MPDSSGDPTALRRPSRPSVAERIGWVPLTCLLGTVLLVGAAALTWIASPYWGRNDSTPAGRHVGVVPVTAATRHLPQLSPDRIVIPKIKAVAPIVEVGTTDGELDVPLNPKVVGWWSPGARPGAAKGTAILAGHINYSGVEGALGTIGTLHPGDAVRIFGTHAGHAAELRFRVTGVRTYHKTRLPYRTIFSQDSTGRLAIVTCGGPFDAATGNYLDNIVVYAVPDKHQHRAVRP